MYKYMKNVFMAMILCFSLEAKDFVVNCDKCVIEVGATNEEIERFKKEKGEDNFYDLADDANYYAYILGEYLKANNIEYKYVSRYKIHYTKLVFPNANIDITKLRWISQYYLYQKGKKPHELMYISDPAGEINNYFNITNPQYPKQEE